MNNLHTIRPQLSDKIRGTIWWMTKNGYGPPVVKENGTVIGRYHRGGVFLNYSQSDVDYCYLSWKRDGYPPVDISIVIYE